MDNPNNKWLICYNCGTEYFDITHNKSCSLCSLKNNFEKDILFNTKREELKSKFKLFLQENYLELRDIETILLKRVEDLSGKMENINNKVTIKSWLEEKNVGYNMCYNIWDQVISDLIKN